MQKPRLWNSDTRLKLIRLAESVEAAQCDGLCASCDLVNGLRAGAFPSKYAKLKAIKPRIARFAASFTQNISWGGLQKLHFADWPHVFFRSFPQPFVILATYGTVFSLSRGLLVYPKPQQSSKAK